MAKITKSTLSYPASIFVDEDESMYVSDSNNHRVMKWKKNAEEGVIVAGGHGKEQSYCPIGLVFNMDRNLYVADGANHRIQMFAICI